ncbi:DUF1684 domain-containing protein [bacterium]|nr:DUF1684 domain-containing protein [bacterium]
MKCLFCILFVVFMIVSVVGCNQPSVDRNEIAHPVHVDSFMGKRMEAEILDYRRRRDQDFKQGTDSPLPAELKVIFTGLEYYPINWNYRFEGPVQRYPNPQKIRMITTSGETRDAIKYGYIRFVLKGKEFKLEVYRLLDLDEKNLLFVPFIDANVGKETYPAGRYIDLIEKDDGLYVIDFNMAYNPSCAYGGSFPCPVTPEENRITVAVPAGEKNLPLAKKIEKAAS